jgi:hypothetical protein
MAIFYLFYMRKVIIPNLLLLHGKKVERYHSVPSKTSYSPIRAEYERYVSYLDAFEGDPDAYWNID